MQLRSTIFLSWLLASALGCMALPPRAQAADCPAKPVLTVKDSQDGFAGKTGTIWTIKPDCSFEVARFRGEQVSAPHLKGQLTPEQQSKLAAVLSTAAVETLPARVGEPPPVNARQISIDYDGKTAVLNLGTGDTAALQGPSHDPAQRLIEISKTVKGVTGDE
jgi:hypothetical protein